jgi:DNA-binding transcriptional ArsR family regulator
MNNSLRREVFHLHAELCQAISDPNRILLLYALRSAERSVGELAEVVAVPQPTVSRHLKVLRERRLVAARRHGTSVYYSLTDPRVLEALDLLRQVLASTIDHRQALTDGLREETYHDRPAS